LYSAKTNAIQREVVDIWQDSLKKKERPVAMPLSTQDNLNADVIHT
jgi:hypothetical protein